MVGAPSSNRCDTCKVRKKKCDEAWPVCGPCTKSHRKCPGRPEIRFVDVSNSKPALQSTGGHPGPTHFHGTSCRWGTSGGNVHMITVQATELNGNTFQKFRLLDTSSEVQARRPTRVPRGLSRSTQDLLAQRLVRAVTPEPSTEQIVEVHGRWLQELPRRVGRSAVLDDAVSFLIASHESFVRGEDLHSLGNLAKYGRALRSLQTAIDDPEEQYSTCTLAAVAVMSRLERATGGAHKKTLHAKALRRMMATKGLRNADDNDLEFFLALECQVTSLKAQDALNSKVPEPCIFDSKYWDAIFQEERGRTPMSMLYWRLIREFVRWPRLSHDILQIDLNSEHVGATIEKILQSAITIADAMEKIWHALRDVLADPRVCFTRPSRDKESPIALVYDFRQVQPAALLAYTCYYSILLHQVIIHLSGMLSNPELTMIPADPPTATLFTPETRRKLPLSQSFVARLQARTLQLSEEIWMIYEQGPDYRTGGSFFTNALTVSYPWTERRELKKYANPRSKIYVKRQRLSKT